MERISLQAVRVQRRRQVGKWITLVFAVAFIVAIVWSWAAASQNQVASHSTHVPEYLGQMELIGQVTGPEAIAEIAKLHGKGIEMADGYMAEYGHAGSRAMVWVAKEASETDASALLKVMADRIRGGTGKQPFRNLRSIDVGGRQVFAVDGPGGDNFFYASDNKVVWLALQIQGGDPIGVVKTALKVF